MEAVVDRRRDEEDARGGGGEEADEKDVLDEAGDALEVSAERRGEQEAEEQLHAGEGDADLVEELGPLAPEAGRQVLLFVRRRRSSARTVPLAAPFG